MGQDLPMQPMHETPMNNSEEHSSSRLINQTGTSNRRNIIKYWPTIIICVIFTITGQSMVRILENMYYLNTNHKRRGTWIQSFLQVVGFPFLRLPLLCFLYYEKPNQLPITSHRTSVRYLAILYPCIGIITVIQARLYARAKLEIPFNVFTLIYTTQLLFTPIFSFLVSKIRFNRWIVISLAFAIAAGSLTLNSSFPGEPNENKVRYATGVASAFFAALTFSILLINIQNVFDNVISKRDVATNRKPSLESVFELIFFSFIVATVFSLAAVFISGEHHILKRDMRGFSMGRKAYVWIMMGQIAAWQIYWVGLVGLVFAVSSLFSNVISVCTWPIVSVVAVLFFDFGKDEFDAFKGVALACAFLSAASYFYRLHKEKGNSHETTS